MMVARDGVEPPTPAFSVETYESWVGIVGSKEPSEKPSSGFRGAINAKRRRTR